MPVGRPRKNPAQTERERMAIRKAVNVSMHALLRLPRELKAALVEKNWSLGQEKFEAALADGREWAIVSLFQMAGVLDAPSVRIAVQQFISGHGVKSEGELEGMIAVVREAEQRTPYERAELMLDELLKLAEDDAEVKALVTRRMVALGSGAEVDE